MWVCVYVCGRRGGLNGPQGVAGLGDGQHLQGALVHGRGDGHLGLSLGLKGHVSQDFFFIGTHFDLLMHVQKSVCVCLYVCVCFLCECLNVCAIVCACECV